MIDAFKNFWSKYVKFHSRLLYSRDSIFHSIQFEESEKEFIPLMKKYFPDADGMSNMNPYTISGWVSFNEEFIKEKLNKIDNEDSEH